jgi:hypothetical protein
LLRSQAAGAQNLPAQPGSHSNRRREELAALFAAERAGLGVAAPGPGDHLFSFGIERCLLTRTTRHGDPQPQHAVWRGEPA